MEIKRDWVIALNEEQILKGQRQSFGRLLKNPKHLATFREEMAEAQRLIEPAACWHAFPVREIRHEKVVLANDTKIGGGPVAAVVAGAEQLIVGVCTVGARISERAEAHVRKKDLFRGMVLSDLASYAVDAVRQQLCRIWEDEAVSRGHRASAPLSPGESAWSVRDQATIFSLVDASQIGVTLTSSLVMVPIKSLSLIMGTGARPMGVEGASNCDFCTIAARCDYRRMRGGLPGRAVM